MSIIEKVTLSTSLATSSQRGRTNSMPVMPDFLRREKEEDILKSLEQRLIDIGFREGGCYWIGVQGSILIEEFAGIEFAITNRQLIPDLSRVQTLAVIMEWSRIKGGFSEYWQEPYLYRSGGGWAVDVDTAITPEDNFLSPRKAEAVVGFAEWVINEWIPYKGRIKFGTIVMYDCKKAVFLSMEDADSAWVCFDNAPTPFVVPINEIALEQS